MNPIEVDAETWIERSANELIEHVKVLKALPELPLESRKESFELVEKHFNQVVRSAINSFKIFAAMSDEDKQSWIEERNQYAKNLKTQLSADLFSADGCVCV
jgi:hypothetical protein